MTQDAAIALSSRRVLLLVKAGDFKHTGGYALYGNPPRWHKIHPHKPAPKAAPVAHDPQSIGSSSFSMPPEQVAQLKLDASNTNAGTFNKQVDKLVALAAAGDAAAILGASFGVNTYGAKAAKIANWLLEQMGVAHQVSAGQKAGTHAAVQAPVDAIPAAPDPAPANDATPTLPPGAKLSTDVNASPLVHTTTPEAAAAIKKDGFKPSGNSMYGKGVYFSSAAQSGAYGSTVLGAKLKPHKQLVLAKDSDVSKAFTVLTGLSSGHLGSDKGAQAMIDAGIGSMVFPVDGETYTVVFDPGLIDVQADAAAGPLTMPAFEEGKTTTGVKAYYEKVAQKVIDQGHAGNASILEGMKEDGLKPNAKGKTTNTWLGKTANSKKLLALHAQALAYAAGDTGPKEGDTKPGADGGTLVLKNGHWVKQGGDEPTPAAKPKHFEINTGDVFKLDSQYQKMNAGSWVVYNVSADGMLVYMHKVGAKVPNQKNSATIPVATLEEAVANGTAQKVPAPGHKTTDGLQESGADAPLAQHVKETLDEKAADGDVEFLQNVAKNNPDHPAIVAYAQKKLAELNDAKPATASPSPDAVSVVPPTGDGLDALNLPASVKDYLLKPSVTLKNGKTVTPKEYIDDLLSAGYGNPEYFAAPKGSQAGFLSKPGKPKLTLNDKQMFYADAAFMAKKKSAKASQPHAAAPTGHTNLPDGWTGSAGSLSTNKDPVNGGIVDKNATLGWFAIANNGAANAKLSGKFFSTQQAAFDALAAAVAASKKKPRLVVKKNLSAGLAAASGAKKQRVSAGGSAPSQLERHDTNVTKVLHAIPSDDAKANFIVLIGTPKAEPGSKFAVIVKDGDTGEVLPDVNVFYSESEALDHAHKLAGGKKPDAGAKEGPLKTKAASTTTGHTKLDQIPWDTLNLPDTNTNAKSHNAAVAKIKAMAYAGDKAGLQAFIDKKAGSKQNYAKKQHQLAQAALAGLNDGGAAPAVSMEGKPAYDAVAIAVKNGAKPIGAAEQWLAANPGGHIELSEALIALGHDDVAADMDLPAPGMEDDAPEPAPAAVSVTADTPLHRKQLAALESLSLDDLKAIDKSPSLPENVQAWIDKKIHEMEQVAKPAATAAPTKIKVDAPLYENTTAGHNKFWSVSTNGKVLKTEYGKIGTMGTSSVKEFPTEQAAKDAAVKLMDKKKANGYVHKGSVKHEHDGGPAASAADSGPKEGDTKQGADGLLVLKNGHWVKVGVDTVDAKTAVSQVPMPKLVSGISKIKYTGIMKHLKDVAENEGSAGLAKLVEITSSGHVKVSGYKTINPNGSVYGANAAMMAQYAKALHQAVVGSGAVPAPVVQSASFPAAADGSKGAIPSMDTWEQTGDQAGSNPGGKFKDPSGQEWYCKFPADADTAKSEVLAAKLYALAGLSGQDAQLITKDGKVGIASKWVNIKKASSAAALAKVPGALDGFAVDAWLGNWDVIGLALDNLQIGPDGKAHRVDAGGSLEYRAQGAKKTFGSKVEEIDTLRDAAKNPHAAAVFGNLKQADIVASVAKVAAISDVAIRAMVNEYGPGTAAEKLKLAETLIARKQDLLKKYPKAAKAKKKPVFKPEEISAPPSFLNWGGSGKSGPSSKEFLNQANEDAVQAIFAAAKTGSLDAIKNLKAKVYDKETGAVIGEKSVLEHPSQHVKGYAQQAVNEVNYQLNPPKRFRFDGGHPLHSLHNAYPAHNGAKSSGIAQKLGKFIVLGEPGLVSLDEVGLPAKITHQAEGGGTLSRKTYKAQAHAAWHKMPKTQRDAIKAYTGSSYKKMNSSLWDGNPTGAAKAAQEAIHTLGHEIQPGTVLSRHIDTSKFEPGEVDKLLASAGKVLQEPAIMSTSIRPSSWVRNIQFKLHVGPGVKGLWVGPGSQPDGGAISVNSSEDELLLPPNTRLLILSVKKAGGSDPDGFGKHGQDHLIEAIILPTD